MYGRIPENIIDLIIPKFQQEADLSKLSFDNITLLLSSYRPKDGLIKFNIIHNLVQKCGKDPAFYILVNFFDVPDLTKIPTDILFKYGIYDKSLSFFDENSIDQGITVRVLAKDKYMIIYMGANSRSLLVGISKNTPKVGKIIVLDSFVIHKSHIIEKIHMAAIEILQWHYLDK